MVQRIGAPPVCTRSLARDGLDLLAQQEGFLRAQGYLPNPVDILSWIDPAPLGAARDMVEARRGYTPVSASCGLPTMR